MPFKYQFDCSFNWSLYCTKYHRERNMSTEVSSRLKGMNTRVTNPIVKHFASLCMNCCSIVHDVLIPQTLCAKSNKSIPSAAHSPCIDIPLPPRLLLLGCYRKCLLICVWSIVLHLLLLQNDEEMKQKPRWWKNLEESADLVWRENWEKIQPLAKKL